MFSAYCSRLTRLRDHQLLSSGFLAVLVVVLALSAPSFARAEVAPAPSWRVTTEAIPTVLPPGIGKHGVYDIAIENVGGTNSTGEITVKDVLPAGFTVTGIEGASCPQIGDELTCSFTEEVVPSGFIVIVIEFEVTSSTGDLTSTVSVSGGGAPSPAVSATTMQAGKTANETGPAGIARYGVEATGPAGEPFTQAGGHPTFLTTTLLYNSMLEFPRFGGHD